MPFGVVISNSVTHDVMLWQLRYQSRYHLAVIAGGERSLTIVLLNPYLSCSENTVDPDQMAYDEAI